MSVYPDHRDVLAEDTDLNFKLLSFNTNSLKVHNAAER